MLKSRVPFCNLFKAAFILDTFNTPSFFFWFHPPLPPHSSVCLGLASTNLRLAVALCLSGRPQEAFYVIAVVCSSWSAVNNGTSQRDILTPLGAQMLPGVRAGNRMVARRVKDEFSYILNNYGTSPKFAKQELVLMRVILLMEKILRHQWSRCPKTFFFSPI